MKTITTLFCIAILFCFNCETYSQTWTKRPGVNLNANCGGYWEYLPVGYNAGDPSKLFPMIIFFHGATEEGDGSAASLDKLVDASAYTWLSAEDKKTALGIPTLINSGSFPSTFNVGGVDYSFIVVALQCKPSAGLADLEQYVNYFLSSYNVDTKRVFLTGLSIGGTRTWIVGGTNASMMSKFAALVPVAGGADYNYRYCSGNSYPCINNGQETNGTMFNQVVNNISPETNTTPRIAAVHGSGDVNWQYGNDYVNNGIKIANPASTAKFIEYGGVGHDSWIRAYRVSNTDFDGMNMYSWMLTKAAAILPVTLTTFDAVAKSNAVELTWSTASESNSSYFAVERSSNGRDFKEIGRVKSSGNSTTAKTYSFTDKAPLTGKNHYRLKMVDLDATFKFSEMRTVSMNGSDLEFSFGPNPVQNEASIRISGNQRVRLTLTITDLMGRTLKSMNFIKSENLLTQKINLAELPAGQYVLSIKGDNVNYTQRIMKR